MKKLLLSSKGSYITDGKYEIFDKPRNELKWAFIITASKSVPDVTYLDRHRKRMKELGWDVEEVDLDSKTPDELRKILKNKDAINMLGGNAFYLLKSIRESGFAESLNEFLDRGSVYCGSSAGAYIVCPTIEMATWKKPEKFDHHGVTDFTALNLVSFLIVAHCTPEIIKNIKPAMDKAELPVKLLTDQQALLVIDDRVELLEDPDIIPKEYGG
ncbi:peptidase E [Patescibacteria group bacterium]|nr:peptidase E [Patescibacteria group bacterium]MBU0964069.1 peptidase E [Patescibacteria group bacterium]